MHAPHQRALTWATCTPLGGAGRAGDSVSATPPRETARWARGRVKVVLPKIYNWLHQESIDRGEISGTSTDMALEPAAARTRIRQLETELAVSRKVNEVFLEQGFARKLSTH